MRRKQIVDAVMELAEEDNGGGICTQCAEIQYGVEPDARGYECDSCGAMAVMGAEEYLLTLV